MSPRGTLGIHSADIHLAGLYAGASDTLIRFWTVGIRDALRCYLDDLLASSILVNHRIDWTLADDCPQRQGVEHSALLVDSAHIGDGARVLAARVDAGIHGWTIGVYGAFRFVGFDWLPAAGTFHIGVSIHSWRTDTLGLVFSA